MDKVDLVDEVDLVDNNLCFALPNSSTMSTESTSSTRSNVSSIISAMFLVGGTCTGGGMLALPVATGLNGLLPSLAIMSISWLAMTATALLLLEVSLWMKEGAHILSMTSEILGKYGKWLGCILFLFISYASLVAYSAGAGVQMAATLTQMTSTPIAKEWGVAIFALLFGGVLFLGNTILGRLNAVLFVGMMVAYFGLIGIGASEVEPSLLGHRQWSGSIMALPLLLTSFSFQTMVPSLTPYLNRNVNGLRIAIVGGTLIAFLVYAIWQIVILGIVPVEGANGLTEAYIRGEPATQFLHEHVEGVWIVPIAQFFAFFAIVTSFLGMGLGLFDFLADGLSIKESGLKKVGIGLLIIVPTILFATYFERIFLVAMETSGGFGDSILNGLIPVAMVWIGRYRLGLDKSNRLPGGKIMLSLIFCFFLFSLILEILIQLGFITNFHGVIA